MIHNKPKILHLILNGSFNKKTQDYKLEFESELD